MRKDNLKTEKTVQSIRSTSSLLLLILAGGEHVDDKRREPPFVLGAAPHGDI
jgi:hypothetical protein